METWKDIKGYEGHYQVSDMGRVKGLKRTVKHPTGYPKTIGSKILNPTVVKGYYQIDLSKEGKRKRFLVHRLVAEAFIENKRNSPQVNHKDGNKENNNVNNLEWVTVSENVLHGYKIGLSEPMSGVKNGHAILNKNKVIEIRNDFSEGVTQKELSERHHVSKSTIQDIVENKTWIDVGGRSRVKNFTKNKTGYKWTEKHRNKYRGRFTHQGKKIDCGLHDTEKEAYEEVLRKREYYLAKEVRKDVKE